MGALAAAGIPSARGQASAATTVPNWIGPRVRSSDEKPPAGMETSQLPAGTRRVRLRLPYESRTVPWKPVVPNARGER